MQTHVPHVKSEYFTKVLHLRVHIYCIFIPAKTVALLMQQPHNNRKTLKRKQHMKECIDAEKHNIMKDKTDP